MTALELLDSHYHTKERELYLYLCSKYNVDAAEISEHRSISKRPSLSFFSGPDAMVFVDDRYHSENPISPMERQSSPHSVAAVYRERVVALYRTQYPELSTFESEEMDQILEARKLRKMLKDPDALMLAVGLEPVLSAEQKKLVHALELLTCRYRGNEHGLYSFLCQKYGVAVDAEYTVDHRSVTTFEYPRHSSARSPQSAERKKCRITARSPQSLPFTPPNVNVQSLTLRDQTSTSCSKRSSGPIEDED